MAGFLAYNPRIRCQNVIIEAKQKNYLKIREAINFIFVQENIKTQEELDKWCGEKGKKKLYSYCKVIAPHYWMQIESPETYVCKYYEKRLKK